MMKEFKEFAMKGNLIDMSIGIVIGAAFGAVSKTFIEGIFMPLVGLVFQLENFDQYAVQIGTASVKVGSFIGATINFLIIAFIMFMLIKAMNSMKKAEAPAPPAGPTPTEALLAEIRDSLKK
ncbi:MAG: large conductance mechanosensitive channel protein MscL [Chitinophagales bacterium]|nr:large conductance mechanosensitive channel protein MscL [Chitinophagales bacterium]